MKKIKFTFLYEVEGYITFRVHVVSGDFSGSTNFCVKHKAIEEFLDSLKSLYETLFGESNIIDTDSNDFIKFQYIKNGHIAVNGQIGGSYNEQFLKFCFDIDQTYLNEFIADTSHFLNY